MTVAIPLQAFFTATKVGKTGLTVTIDVDKYAKSDRTRTRVVTGGSAVEGANGLYTYVVAGVTDAETHDYVGVFKTADVTVDFQHIPSWQQDYIGAAAIVLAYIDAAISTRLAAAAYTVPPSAATNATAVRSELATELARVDVAISTRNATTPPTAGAIADAVLDEALAEHTTTGSVGAALGDLSSVPATYLSTYDPATNAINFVYGDDYHANDNRALDFTSAHTLTGGAVAWRVQTASGVVAIACTVLSANQYRLAPTAAQLATIGVGVWFYDLEITNVSSRVITDRQGYVTVRQDVR